MQSPLPARRSRLGRALALGLLSAAVAVGAGVLLAASRPGEPLPVLGQLPPYSMTDQLGRVFDSRELAGKVWIANFIFTRCPTVCPRFSAQMAQIQERTDGLGEGVRLVSFSVDPEYDTPERLLEYAQRFQAGSRWSFLTGDAEAMKRTVVDGMKIAMGGGRPDADFAAIFHGEHFVLLDGQARIRGYYHSLEEGSVEAVSLDARRLLEGAP